VSVVVPVFNDPDGIDALLSSLATQTVEPSRFEVLVVDDGSTDSTAEVVRRHALARLLFATSRRGSYAARNLGVANARGHLLAFTDADCAPARDWIQEGMRCFESDRVDMVAGHVAVPLGPHRTIAAMVDAAVHLDQRRYAAEGFGATANLWATRAVVDRIGMFNPALRSGGDKEFGLRATGAGARLVYGERVVVEHRPRTRLTQLARKAYRLGVGTAHHVYRGTGPLAHRDKSWTDPGAYLPPRPTQHVIDRLRDRVDASPRDLTRMYWAHYFFVRLPTQFGGVAGATQERLRHWGRAVAAGDKLR
jgi:glycosyltransferase involved in cell wall biosynthesis